MGKKLAFMSGLLIGGFAGWVLGTLSAPQSGRETLDAWGEKAIELRERAGEAAGQVRERLNQARESARGALGREEK
ncbi:MAG: YtxH domain-containing protein [Chloroflexi bacterium]|nr:YtxH domain-containing protein [Chloroflexota bacterium]